MQLFKQKKEDLVQQLQNLEDANQDRRHDRQYMRHIRWVLETRVGLRVSFPHMAALITRRCMAKILGHCRITGIRR